MVDLRRLKQCLCSCNKSATLVSDRHVVPVRSCVLCVAISERQATPVRAGVRQNMQGTESEVQNPSRSKQAPRWPPLIDTMTVTDMHKINCLTQ